MLRVMTAVVALLTALFAIGATDPARDLEAAVYREVVQGDLRGAAAEYRRIASAQAGAPRAVAARALLQLGYCMEKWGKLGEAREAYQRTIREFADQAAIVSRARGRLAEATGWVPGPLNLDFSDGAAGRLPPAWFVPALPGDADRWAQVRTSGCRAAKGSCAVVMAPENAPERVSNLMQSFSARAYRGRTVRFAAWLRVESTSPDDHARMWLSVDRAGERKGFFDDMSDRPIRSSQWIEAEIRGHVEADASFIKFGVMSVGRGRVWVDSVFFSTVP